MTRLKNVLNEQLHRWIKKRSPSGNPQYLSSRHIYILPSLFGWSYVFIVLTLGVGAINYQLNSAFLLVFLMMVIGVMNLWSNHRNLQGIGVHCLAIEDVEQGQPAKITLVVSAQTENHYALFLSLKGEPHAVSLEDINKEGKITILAQKTPIRGRFKLPPIKIYSDYPLGLSRSWTYLYFDIDYYVYPYAISPGFWPNAHENQNQASVSLNSIGDEELYELKSVTNPWVQTSHIAWKISARGQGWYLKRMTSPTNSYWLFRLEDLPPGDIELRLQQLSDWIQTAERLGHRYSLELKGTRTPLGVGKAHMNACLRQLATY
ncbi:hypothetical protein [Legionella nagasakiensis]|uniref:hypothetical protein n=1 Tax=Legionella nagasakiensis TaxID=535290 RepID=UPI0010541888|nr:hypothetical protein [Legionella nagasakiensis]